MKNSIRVAIAGLFHETNTFATEVTGYTTVESMTQTRGADILERSGSLTRAAVDVCLEEGWEIVPTAMFEVGSTFGLIDADTYAKLKNEILTRLAAQLPVDVVSLLIHGAGTVEGIADLEGDLAKSIREIAGEKVKIAAAADLHGKVTELMAQQYDAFEACKEYPHVDGPDCVKSALRRAVAAARGESRPIFRFRKIPILMGPTTTFRADSFTSKIRDLCIEYERNPAVLNCSVMHGFPYQDIAEVGMYAMVTTEGDEALADRVVDELAQWIWDHRHESRTRTPTVEEAVAQAADILRQRAERGGAPVKSAMNLFRPHDPSWGPVVIGDVGDNPGGGATGDSTHLLRALMAAKLGKVAFLSIRDAETVKQAISAGVGASINVRLGGKLDRRNGGPIEGKAYVKSISDGRDRVRGPMCTDMVFDLGPTVCLRMADIDIIVVCGLGQAFDDVQGRAHGIMVDEYDVVCVKSSAHFRGFFQQLSNAVLDADSPGMTSTDPLNFPHPKLRHPWFPKDHDAAYPIRSDV